MKSVIRWFYIALVGLIVFTGALFIAQGAITCEEKPQAVAEPIEVQRAMPDGPALPV